MPQSRGLADASDWQANMPRLSSQGSSKSGRLTGERSLLERCNDGQSVPDIRLCGSCLKTIALSLMLLLQVLSGTPSKVWQIAINSKVP